MGGTLQLLRLLNPKSNSSLSWLVCKMCMCSSCLFVNLKMIERGENEDHDKMKGKDEGQLLVVKEETWGRMATSKKIQQIHARKGL